MNINDPAFFKLFCIGSRKAASFLENFSDELRLKVPVGK
jgi:hypothetical protein